MEITYHWEDDYLIPAGDVREDEEGLKTMSNLGQNMAHLLKALKEAVIGLY